MHFDLLNRYSLQSVAAVEYVTHFVSYHVLDSLTCGFQVLARIEVARVFYQVLTDGSGHCQAQVGIDVDFANTEFACLQQHVFRYALSAVQLAAVLVAFFNKGRG